MPECSTWMPADCRVAEFAFGDDKLTWSWLQQMSAFCQPSPCGPQPPSPRQCSEERKSPQRWSHWQLVACLLMPVQWCWWGQLRSSSSQRANALDGQIGGLMLAGLLNTAPGPHWCPAKFLVSITPLLGSNDEAAASAEQSHVYQTNQQRLHTGTGFHFCHS